MVADDEVSTLLDRRYDLGTHVVAIRVLRVPESATFPDGVKYAFHYGSEHADDPLLRYDNHHGVHERHDRGGVEEIEFHGYETLLERFRDELPIAFDPRTTDGHPNHGDDGDHS